MMNDVILAVPVPQLSAFVEPDRRRSLESLSLQRAAASTVQAGEQSL